MAGSVPGEIVEAVRTGRPVRVHASDGEVVVARVIDYDEERVVYAALTSSHPERYAVCDSTGFTLELAKIERVRLLDEPRRRRD